MAIVWYNVYRSKMQNNRLESIYRGYIQNYFKRERGIKNDTRNHP